MPKPEIELTLMKFYRRPPGQGWRFTILDLINFDDTTSVNKDWSLLTIDWQPDAPDGTGTNARRLTFHLF
jgi:hypothetical protein